MSCVIIGFRAAPVVLVLCIFAANPLSSQVVGRVTDLNGTGLAGVTVDLWNSTMRIATAQTDRTGRYQFLSDVYRRGDLVTFRLIGYHPKSVRRTSLREGGELVLRPLAVSLPELTVTTALRFCPNSDEPGARQAWEGARAKYSQDTARRGMAVRMLQDRTTVETSEVGFFDETKLEPAWRRWVGATWPPTGGRYSLVHPQVAERGYAIRVDVEKGPPLNSDYFEWRYPELDRGHASHFVADEFGQLHSFSVMQTEGDDLTIVFCARRKDRPHIQGTLIIGPDTTLVSASWVFETDSPDEDAGGEVTFAPPNLSSGSLPHLLPARGTFWRRLKGRERYLQRTSVYLEWVISLTEAMPDLPRAAR